MEEHEKYLQPENLAKLHGLMLRARRIVEGYVAGLHRSPFHGFSIEFAEHREYAQGDDLRYVDWKVFGRTDKIYLKQFEDETNLVCYLVLDISESMQYKGPDSPLSKFEYAQAIAAALAWLRSRARIHMSRFGCLGNQFRFATLFGRMARSNCFAAKRGVSRGTPRSFRTATVSNPNFRTMSLTMASEAKLKWSGKKNGLD